MKFKLILFLIVIYLVFFGWGGQYFMGAPRMYDTRINYYPLLVVFSYNPSNNAGDVNPILPTHIECVIYPFERYVVWDEERIMGYPMQMTVRVTGASCDGFAYFIAPEHTKNYEPQRGNDEFQYGWWWIKYHIFKIQ